MAETVTVLGQSYRLRPTLPDWVEADPWFVEWGYRFALDEFAPDKVWMRKPSAMTPPVPKGKPILPDEPKKTKDAGDKGWGESNVYSRAANSDKPSYKAQHNQRDLTDDERKQILEHAQKVVGPHGFVNPLGAMFDLNLDVPVHRVAHLLEESGFPTMPKSMIDEEPKRYESYKNWLREQRGQAEMERLSKDREKQAEEKSQAWGPGSELSRDLPYVKRLSLGDGTGRVVRILGRDYVLRG